MAKTAIAYIDGFNFYHGVVKGAAHLKWLDYPALCDRLLRGYKVTKINYYTARVKNRPSDPGQSQRQDAYIRALDADPRVRVVFGQFQKKSAGVLVREGREAQLIDGSTALLAEQMVWGKTWEEKGSDVNLGTDLSWDACQGLMNAALVLSNDLDLQHPINRAMAAHVEVVVVNPHHRTNNNPSLIGHGTRKLNVGDLRRCQLPEEVSLATGVVVKRPAVWA